jgi:hypothetical protein
MLDKKIIKVIKAHRAYNLNLAREEEVSATLLLNEDGTAEIDDWGTLPESSLEGGVYPSLKAALDALLTAEESWYLEGL